MLSNSIIIVLLLLLIYTTYGLWTGNLTSKRTGTAAIQSHPGNKERARTRGNLMTNYSGTEITTAFLKFSLFILYYYHLENQLLSVPCRNAKGCHLISILSISRNLVAIPFEKPYQFEIHVFLCY